jgi:hypothetical protein
VKLFTESYYTNVECFRTDYDLSSPPSTKPGHSNINKTVYLRKLDVRHSCHKTSLSAHFSQFILRAYVSRFVIISPTSRNEVKGKGKAVPLHAMEALGGRGGITPTHSRPRH